MNKEYKEFEEALRECARQYADFRGLVSQYIDALKAWRKSDGLNSETGEKSMYKLITLEERIKKWLKEEYDTKD